MLVLIVGGEADLGEGEVGGSEYCGDIPNWWLGIAFYLP